MLWRLASVDWEQQLNLPLALVTLTYPRDFPFDGRKVKRDLRCFRSRWTRKYGECPRGAWALEFQRRGAPHVHLYVALPEEWQEVERWARVAWYGVVGSGDPAHRAWGVDVTPCSFGSAADNASRIGEYFYKHNAKTGGHYQKDVPDGFESVGRFWGVWGIRGREHGLTLTRDEYVQVRRLVWRLYRARRGHLPGRSQGLDGAWSLVDSPEATVLRYVTWMRQDRPERSEGRDGITRRGGTATPSSGVGVRRPLTGHGRPVRSGS
jgi:hypothetical protein